LLSTFRLRFLANDGLCDDIRSSGMECGQGRGLGWVQSACSRDGYLVHRFDQARIPARNRSRSFCIDDHDLAVADSDDVRWFSRPGRPAEEAENVAVVQFDEPAGVLRVNDPSAAMPQDICVPINNTTGEDLLAATEPDSTRRFGQTPNVDV
jgi:hypothetical protein